MKITNEEDFVAKMAAKRKELRLSIRALGASSGIPKSTLSLIERGERSISLDNAIKIAKALDIEVNI